MKFTLVIAALFATSAIAAPCGKGHNHNDGVTTIPDQVKTPTSGDVQNQEAQINTGKGPVKGGDANGALIAAPITAPIDISDNQILNNVLGNVLSEGNVSTKQSKNNEIEQKQHN
ncbi:hypothetical protein BJ944DRAFT_240201 [Cunninghamella echinulata]|nr:hypothetical protein BJ944DRAFT_240201 [Cunninghamella echinulata]